MGTYTPNLNLYKPDANDDFGSFRAEFNDNMDKLDNGGGGGGGGHTIVDENGSDMPAESKLQFTGNVSVTDDNVNGATVVDILGGGGDVYGAFIDTSNVIVAGTTYRSSMTYTATEDCFIRLYIVTQSGLIPQITIDGTNVGAVYFSGTGGFTNTYYLKKSQTIAVTNTNTSTNSSYAVYGLTQGTNGIFAPVIYSDTERKIGVWRDNKPMYQKTVHISALPSGVGSPTTYAHNISDIDTICDYEGVIHYSNGNASKFDRLAMKTDGTATLDPISCIVAYVTKTDINVTVGANRSTASADFTIRYTKTTDVAGSGDYNTYGVPTVHYSTSEQVIGTWVDGKPLYQKSFSVTSPANNTSTNIIDVTSLNIDICSKCEGVIYNASNNTHEGGGSFVLWVRKNWQGSGDDFVACTVSNASYFSNDMIVTIQYTKTTD